MAFVLLLLAATGGLALTGASPTVPSVGGPATYPEVVSDMFVQRLPAGAGPAFGLVGNTLTASEPDDTLVIQRRGAFGE